MNRSPNPIVYVYVKFGLSVPHSTIVLFRTTLEKFVEDRPQEWAAFCGFRTSRVEAQMNFVEYMVALQHRLTWQSLVPVKESRAEVASFCVEIQKQLGCRYEAPSLPVEICLNEDSDSNETIPFVNDKELSEAEYVALLMESAEQFKKKES